MKQKVLIIGKVWPEPESSAAGTRMLQIIHALKTKGYELSFACAASDSEFMCDLSSLGVEKINITLNHSSFDDLIKELNPDIVLFDRFSTEEQYGWRVAEHCPDALRILDTEDLHCLRAARHIALKENRSFQTEDLFNTITHREIASIYRCDLSLIISEYEIKVLQDVFKVDASLLLHLPFMLDPLDAEKTDKWPLFKEREQFISIGNFLHEPNWDAVLQLKKKIWPLIRKELPKAELCVYGAYPTQKVFELHQPKEGFLIKGRAKDVNEVMSKAKVCLAPLRFGAGLKGKLIDAMLNGTPSVTTGIGAESMHGSLEWNGFICDDPEEFASAAVKLYTNETLWKDSQSKAPTIINTVYSKKKYEIIFIQTLLSIKSNITKHRKNNFTGAMLLQHTSLSSKYMALWIEAKNK